MGRVDLSRSQPQQLTDVRSLEHLIDVDAVESEIIDRKSLEFKAGARVVNMAMIDKGYDTVLDIIGTVENPNVLSTVVSFTVPNGLVAMVNQIAVFYSDPLVSACFAVGWRIVVNGNQVPNISVNNFNYRYGSLGSAMETMKIRPIWLQSEMTIELEIDPVANKVDGFDEHLVAMGRLSGEIYKPSTSDVQIVGV